MMQTPATDILETMTRKENESIVDASGTDSTNARVTAKIEMTEGSSFLRRKFWRENLVASRKDMV
jgi:hypothetical protein